MGHATRVQGDKDVVIIPGARAKPLDPSLPQGRGVVPVGAKVGIDATIPEGIPLEHYERITYAYADKAMVDDYVKGKKDAVGQIGRRARGRGAGETKSSKRSTRRRCTTPTLRALLGLRFQHGGPRARPSAQDREALAGPARTNVRARQQVRGGAAGEEITTQY